MLLVTSVAQLAGALVLPGLLISPNMIVSAILLQRLMPRSVLTQALVWQNSASAAGIAAATALAGYLVDASGARSGFGLGAAALTAAAVCVSVGRRSLGSPRSSAARP